MKAKMAKDGRKDGRLAQTRSAITRIAIRLYIFFPTPTDLISVPLSFPLLFQLLSSNPNLMLQQYY